MKWLKTIDGRRAINVAHVNEFLIHNPNHLNASGPNVWRILAAQGDVDWHISDHKTEAEAIKALDLLMRLFCEAPTTST
jgi:hypothetical protein